MAELRFVTQQDLDEYMAAGSPFATLLPDDSPAKQMISRKLYGGLLGWRRSAIVDVGCGRSPLVNEMGRVHDYIPIDPRMNGCDWRALADNHGYDLVIANDLFPNVDQGLADFLANWYGKAELRLSLTVYENRYYRAQRIDGDEILTVRAWDWYQTREVLTRFGIRAHSICPPKESLFPNGRQVALLRC